jgi:hypothetical protein
MPIRPAPWVSWVSEAEALDVSPPGVLRHALVLVGGATSLYTPCSRRRRPLVLMDLVAHCKEPVPATMEKLKREVAALRAELDVIKRAVAPMIRKNEAKKAKIQEEKLERQLQEQWSTAMEGLGVNNLGVTWNSVRGLRLEMLDTAHPFQTATHVFVPYVSPYSYPAHYGVEAVGVELPPHGTWGDLLKAADRSCDKVQALVTAEAENPEDTVYVDEGYRVAIYCTGFELEGSIVIMQYDEIN